MYTCIDPTSQHFTYFSLVIFVNRYLLAFYGLYYDSITFIDFDSAHLCLIGNIQKFQYCLDYNKNEECAAVLLSFKAYFFLLNFDQL